MLWTAETADNVYEMGTDTLVVMDGKIVAQSFAGKITPKHWREPELANGVNRLSVSEMTPRVTGVRDVPSEEKAWTTSRS